MANAFSLAGDYHVNEVIGLANTLGQAGKNMCGSEQEAPRWMVRSLTAPTGKFSDRKYCGTRES